MNDDKVDDSPITMTRELFCNGNLYHASEPKVQKDLALLLDASRSVAIAVGQTTLTCYLKKVTKTEQG